MGRQCSIARVEGKLVTYGWITFDTESIGELDLAIRLKKGEAYIWDCATLPAYRGHRLYPGLLAYMLRELQRAGAPAHAVEDTHDALLGNRDVLHPFDSHI